MPEFEKQPTKRRVTRRDFFKRAGILAGAAALADLAGSCRYPIPSSGASEPGLDPVAIAARRDAIKKAVACFDPGIVRDGTQVSQGDGAVVALNLDNPANPAEGGTYTTVVMPYEITKRPIVVQTSTDGTLDLVTAASYQNDGSTRVNISIRNTRTKQIQGGVYTETLDPSKCSALSMKWKDGVLEDPTVNNNLPRDLRRFKEIAP